MATKQQYDVSRDGRFLINTDLQDTATEPIHLLHNWHLQSRDLFRPATL